MKLFQAVDTSSLKALETAKDAALDRDATKALVYARTKLKSANPKERVWAMKRIGIPSTYSRLRVE